MDKVISESLDTEEQNQKTVRQGIKRKQKLHATNLCRPLYPHTMRLVSQANCCATTRKYQVCFERKIESLIDLTCGEPDSQLPSVLNNSNNAGIWTLANLQCVKRLLRVFAAWQCETLLLLRTSNFERPRTPESKGLVAAHIGLRALDRLHSIYDPLRMKRASNHVLMLFVSVQTFF